ncbi:MAG TPA: hypothetical protein VKY74_12910 [Chloroflexia bacterium]|nr:hypothetical protein [Chloroflexia bacterium]
MSNPVPFQGANNTVLKGVAAIATDDVWAVGDSDGTLTLHWDGLAWRVVPSPSPRLGVPRLEGVVALAANDVWAVGSTGEDHFRQSLIEHWDGRTWNVVPSPAAEPVDSELLGLAAATPDDIWAVGIRHRPDGAKSLVEHWDGHAWRVVPSANVDSGKALSDTGLNAVAVRGDDVWTAGYFSHYQNGPEQMLIQHWNCGTRITPLSLTGKP